MNYKTANKCLTGGVMILALTTTVFAQEKPFTQPGTGQPPAPPPPLKAAAPAAAPPASAAAQSAPEPGPVEKFFNGKIPEAFSKGKFNLNARLRYEFVDQNGVPAITDPSHAPTIRTRFGFTTAPLYGFTGMIEGENVSSLGPERNYNAAGANGQPQKPVVADPVTTELNQAWVAYSRTNLAAAKVGRQRIALDNHRFVGDVGWRQNMQTFDAAGLEIKPVRDFNLSYSYLWDVHRVFGDVSGLPAASPNHDFESDSHLINASYSRWRYGRFVGYSYLLDLDLNNGTATRFDNSSASFGGYFAGSAPVSDKASLGYRGEFAWQTDYGGSQLDYDAIYYNVELSANVKPFAFGAGYETLGSARNDSVPGARVGFKTPLATLHAFNGWADSFLATPNAGLRDLYGFAQVTLPAQVPLRFVYHKFDADNGGADFGQEFDVVASKKLGKYWTALLKYAFYDGQDAAAPALALANVDIHKFWAQVEFNF
ncbi:MAG: alginate export family protein [Chloroflexi bacterium]|nr:alginate export family protein [Chloroflexota bacterium]